LSPSSIATGAGGDAVARAAASNASRPAFTSSICAFSSSMTSSSRRASAFRCSGKGRPSPVRNPSSRSRRSERLGS
jgi:hypothetical protein